MQIIIDNMEITIEHESRGIRVKSETYKILLENQNEDEIVTILNKNYLIVTTYFYSRIGSDISPVDFKRVCIRIVFHYLFMYNTWRNMYSKERHRDLTFLSKDFVNPTTNDIIIQYFKEKYPNDYAKKCELMLDMSSEIFKEYDKNRQDFKNMF